MGFLTTSRFITLNDSKFSKVILELPNHWWSRPYEYAWASSFIHKNHVILDGACGICHPFKFYLSNICEKVYACDLDERIVSKEEILKDIYTVFGMKAMEFPLEYLDKIDLSCQDITNTTYENAMFDRIICISVLEHLDENALLQTLSEFKRILKPDGFIVMTIDYPYLDLKTFAFMVEKSGLSFADDVDFELPENALKTSLFPEFQDGLYSFRALLKKNGVIEQE